MDGQGLKGFDQGGFHPQCIRHPNHLTGNQENFQLPRQQVQRAHPHDVVHCHCCLFEQHQA